MTMQPEAQDRRRARRFPAAELKAQMKVKKGLFSEWIDIGTQDYNKLGLAIETDRELEVGQNVTLSITLLVDMGEITIDKIEGAVRNIASNGFHKRYGIEFIFDGKKASDYQTQLDRIESMLERSTRLQERMSSQQNNSH